ncbi:MAG TPA: hypothetical protein VFA33_05145 [Bryobacteraceae bacterium]|nr:hypothetical protein [Bryobacteraceae bacterium]
MYGSIPNEGIAIRVPNPPKTARVRLPTTEEMLGRLAQQKSIRRTIGRRKSQTEYVSNPKADLALFNQIRLDKDGPEFDEFEAGNAISKLTFCDVTGCERVGDEYQITLKTPFGDTVHTMKIPTQRDITVYRRTVVSSTDLPHGQEELRYRIEPAMDLYDSTVSKIEGYADGYKAADVPPHHKSAVVVELVQAIEDMDPSLDPNS